MFAGVVFISLYTAQLTATLTTEKILGSINGPDDLPGKTVATLLASPATAYGKTIGAVVKEYDTVEDLQKALLEGKVDAILANGPALRYFARHEGSGLVRVVGEEINRQEIGFLFQLGSPLRKSVGSALLQVREDGTYQQIYEKWFGDL
jgi:polar amino acid transport system substrate-binding protein